MTAEQRRRHFRIAQRFALLASDLGIAEEVVALLTGGPGAESSLATAASRATLDDAASVAPGVEVPSWADRKEGSESSDLTKRRAAMENVDTELSSLRKRVSDGLSSPKQRRKRGA